MTRKDILPVYAGVALLSVASLALEISYTRFFSITRWHHFAFMVISMALLGYSAAGSLLALRPGALSKKTLSFLWVGSMGFSAAALLGYIGANLLPLDPARAAWDTRQFFLIVPLYLLVASPFFFTGLNFAAALTIYREKTHGIYASDLLGAGLGCGITMFIFNFHGCASAIPICAALGALSGSFFALGLNKKTLVLALGIMVFILTLVFLKPGFLHPKISPFKDLTVALQYPGSCHVETRWNAFSRIDMIESPAARFAPGMSLGFNGSLPTQIGMTIDGGNINAITLLEGKSGERDFIHWLPASLPYTLNHPGRILLIEPGGNLDFIMAETYKATSITATVLNPLVKQALEKSLPNLLSASSALLQIIPESGRAFLGQRPNARFDIVRLPITGALAAASSGLYGLHEQYDNTVEAFTIYLSSLSKNGMLSVSRYLLPPPREELRILAVAVSALQNLGIDDPGSHLAAYRSLTTLEILICREQLKAKQLNKIRAFCNKNWFDIVYLPDMSPDEANRYIQFPKPIYADFFRKLLEPQSRSDLFDTYIFDIRPITDDRPFLSHFFKWSTLREVVQTAGGKWQIFLEGGYLVPVVAFQALVMAIILVMLPLMGKHVNYLGIRWAIPFILLIGFGFIFLEIGMIHRMTLYFGHPYHAFALTLSMLLVSSGIGSRLFGHRIHDTRTISLLAISISIIVFADGLLTSFFLVKTYTWNPIWRMMVACLFMGATGFILGIPFPSALRLIHKHSKSIGNVPWAWSINGGATVVGSTLAAMMALELGIQTIFSMSAVCYAAAGVCTLISGTSKISFMAKKYKVIN